MFSSSGQKLPLNGSLCFLILSPDYRKLLYMNIREPFWGYPFKIQAASLNQTSTPSSSLFIPKGTSMKHLPLLLESLLRSWREQSQLSPGLQAHPSNCLLRTFAPTSNRYVILTVPKLRPWSSSPFLSADGKALGIIVSSSLSSSPYIKSTRKSGRLLLHRISPLLPTPCFHTGLSHHHILPGLLQSIPSRSILYMVASF